MSDAELRAFDALAGHARLSDLAAIARALATTAAESRRIVWTDVPKVKAMAEEMKLTEADASTPFGNALHVLERGPEDAAERALARALWAHAIAEQPPKGRDDEDRVASDLLWLATHTPLDATSLLDRALGEAASDLWDAIADRIRRVDQGKIATLGRAEALVAGAALASSKSSAAAKHAASLATEVKDPALARMLGAAPARVEAHLTGELTHAPRGLLATTLLAVTGLLFVIHGARVLARLALAYKRPAEVKLSDGTVTVHAKTMLLGRTVREVDLIVPREGLVRIEREVRYPRLAFYAGLLALAVGSYVGVAILIDGARAASPSLVLTGLLIVAAGVVLDLVLGSLQPGTAGKCRVLVVSSKGPSVCIAMVDAKLADLALAKLAGK